MNARSLCGGLLAVVLSLGPAAPARGEDKSSDLAIIVNKAVGLDDVSAATLMHYFKGEKAKAPDGTKLVVVMFDFGHPEREAALKGIFQMSESELNDYYVGAIFTGALNAAPKELASATEVRQFVAGTAGGIGYVRGSDVDPSVKVVKVDGMSPGEAGYPLKAK